ncbi:MAG: hypothetical protein RML92_08460 [Bacteroidia bacterium]|nr:hypothetical protein [Bacteroidia bacterium]
MPFREVSLVPIEGLKEKPSLPDKFYGTLNDYTFSIGGRVFNLKSTPSSEQGPDYPNYYEPVGAIKTEKAYAAVFKRVTSIEAFHAEIYCEKCPAQGVGWALFSKVLNDKKIEVSPDGCIIWEIALTPYTNTIDFLDICEGKATTHNIKAPVLKFLESNKLVEFSSFGYATYFWTATPTYYGVKGDKRALILVFNGQNAQVDKYKGNSTKYLLIRISESSSQK